MVKKLACVVVSVVATLVLFVLFSYLMSNVNPKPNPKPIQPEPPPASRRTNSNAHDPYQKEVLFPNTRRLTYGLEKAPESDIAKQGTALVKMIPLYRHVATHGLLLNDSYVKEIVSPIHSPCVFKNGSIMIKCNDTNLTLSSTSPSVKGFRRSVDNIELTNRIIEENSDVVLKIIDDSGHPRIEIKLKPAGFYEGTIRKYRSSVNGKVYNDSEALMEGFMGNAKSTVIEILPNNTVRFDDNENFLDNFQNNFTGEENNLRIKLSDNIESINKFDSQRQYKKITVFMTSKDHKNAIRESSDEAYWNSTDMLHFNMLGNETKNLQQTTRNLTEKYVSNNNADLNIVSEITKENTYLKYDEKSMPSNIRSNETNTISDSFDQVNATTNLVYDGKGLSSNVTSIETTIINDSFDQVNTTTNLAYDEKGLSSNVTSIETTIISDSFDQVTTTTESAYDGKGLSSNVTSIETTIISDSFDQVNTTTESEYDGKGLSSNVTSIETTIISDSFNQVNTTTESEYDGKGLSSNVTSIEMTIISDSFNQVNTTTESEYDGKGLSSNVTFIETTIISDSFDQVNTTTDLVYDEKGLSSHITSTGAPTEIKVNRNISDY